MFLGLPVEILATSWRWPPLSWVRRLSPVTGEVPFRPSSLVFCNRPPAVPGIGQRYRQFRILTRILCAMRLRQRPCQGRDCSRRMRRCRTSPTPLPGMNICTGPCTSGALPRLRSVGEGQTRSDVGRFCPISAWKLAILTPVRGCRRAHAFHLGRVDPGLVGGVAALARSVGRRAAVSNRGPGSLHPEPAGRRPLALQRSGPNQPARLDINAANGGPRRAIRAPKHAPNMALARV